MSHQWLISGHSLQEDYSPKDFCQSIGPKNCFDVSSVCNNGDGEVLMQPAHFLCRFIFYQPVQCEVIQLTIYLMALILIV